MCSGRWRVRPFPVGPWRHIRVRPRSSTQFADGGLEFGKGLPVNSRLLDRTKVETAARYTHLTDDSIKAVGNSIASRIAEISE